MGFFVFFIFIHFSVLSSLKVTHLFKSSARTQIVSLTPAFSRFFFLLLLSYPHPSIFLVFLTRPCFSNNVYIFIILCVPCLGNLVLPTFLNLTQATEITLLVNTQRDACNARWVCKNVGLFKNLGIKRNSEILKKQECENSRKTHKNS